MWRMRMWRMRMRTTTCACPTVNDRSWTLVQPIAQKWSVRVCGAGGAGLHSVHQAPRRRTQPSVVGARNVEQRPARAALAQ